MPEDDCYISGLTGVEMVQFGARLSGLPAVEGLRRAHEILDFAGIEQERYRPVETYSTGMRQKLKFAQAIVHDPPLLILDEPTAGLDPEERVAMLSRISILVKKVGKTTIISTHILPDVQASCDQVIILARGRVVVADRLDALNRPTSPGYTIRVWGSAESIAHRLRPRVASLVCPDASTLTARPASGYGPSSPPKTPWRRSS
jgi:ABC-2 type transport system ATP-binding protein